MIAHNLCYTTLINEKIAQSATPPALSSATYLSLSVLHRLQPWTLTTMSKRRSRRAPPPILYYATSRQDRTENLTRCFRLPLQVKTSLREGLLPRILKSLLAARSKAKNDLKNVRLIAHSSLLSASLDLF